jgi:hypothetical protein
MGRIRVGVGCRIQKRILYPGGWLLLLATGRAGRIQHRASGVGGMVARTGFEPVLPA